MRKGSLIKFFFDPVLKHYLCIYKYLPTLPIPVWKKKEEKKFLNFLPINGLAIDVFQSQRLFSKHNDNFFFAFTNEMLLRKKQVNKNFFFNEKLLIFVPLHKKFFQ
jgi:hypothetical protein